MVEYQNRHGRRIGNTEVKIKEITNIEKKEKL